MKKQIVMFAAVCSAFFSANAQILPKPSPTSEVKQEIGVAKVSVEYSRPGVKGRKVFGGLLPYGELWRFGANTCTKISTDESLFFGTNELKAGTYSVFAIPNKDNSWDIIFNTDTKQGGTTDYTKDKDVFRMKATAKENPFTETFTLNFDNIKDNSATLVALWENLRVEIPFTLNTDVSAKANIDAAIAKGENLDKVYNNAANYFFSKDNKTALDYAEKSLAVKESYGALFLKARILKEQGDKGALSLGQKALALAEKDGNKGFAEFISSTIKKW